MTEQEWLTSSDPAAMLEHLLQRVRGGWGAEPQPLSDRKLLLFGCVCWEAYRRRGYSTSTFEEEVRIAFDWIDAPAVAGELAHPWNLHLLRAADFARSAIEHYTKAGIVPARYQTPAGIRGSRQRLPLVDAASFLRDICGNPFRFQCLCGQNDVPVAPAPCYGCNAILSWNNGLVPKLAQQMYTSRNFADMPLLADALEEAGCENFDIIWHLRGWDRCPCLGQDDACSLCIRNGVATGMRQTNTSHVRGCWVIDLLLNRE